MSETLKPETLARKKVLGIPVLYLAGGFVVVLVVIAWRTKTTKAVDTAATATTTPVATIGGDLYPTMPQGTVIVAPATGGLPGTNSTITSNDEWVKAGMVTLAKAGYSPGTAQLALQAYLNGDQLSIEQGKMRDSAISANGAPPVLTSVGDVIVPQTPVNTPAVVPANSEISDPRQSAIAGYYQNILGRNAAQTEINQWNATGASLGIIQSSISGSPEARRNAIAGYYRSILGRAASNSELNQWDATGADLATIQTSILNSPEAQGR